MFYKYICFYFWTDQDKKDEISVRSVEAQTSNIAVEVHESETTRGEISEGGMIKF